MDTPNFALIVTRDFPPGDAWQKGQRIEEADEIALFLEKFPHGGAVRVAR
jgi:hypothetical protein